MQHHFSLVSFWNVIGLILEYLILINNNQPFQLFISSMLLKAERHLEFLAGEHVIKNREKQGFSPGSVMVPRDLARSSDLSIDRRPIVLLLRKPA